MLDAIQVVDLPARNTAVIRLKIPQADIAKVMGPAIDEVFSALKAQGIAPAGPLPAAPRPSPGSGTAPSLSRTPPTVGAGDGAGAGAAGGGRKGISVWQVLHLSLAPPGGMRRSSMLYAVWQDGHVTRMGRNPEASRLPRGVRGRRTLRA